ncbi:MAG: hypothetical protein IJF67_04285 [Clostridia bacterium]|nr:hypothetical protein [Clostridia bacterium]
MKKNLIFPGRRILCAGLALLLMLGCAACGGGEPAADTMEPGANDSENLSAAGYDYAGHDLGGKTYTILNCPKDLWSMRCVICPDELNGETINDAMFNRNAEVMQKLNCRFEEINAADSYSTTDILGKSVLAGDDTYQIAYLPLFHSMTPIEGEWLHCLTDIDTLQLTEPWWNGALLEATEVGGKNYFASSYLHLMGIDGIWCMFFNQNLMDSLKLDYPYDLVREGKWTLDRLREYCAAAANLNGDDSFTFNPYGKAVYGTASIMNGVTRFLYGAGLDFVKKDTDGSFVSNLQNEHFNNVLQSYASFFGAEGIFVNAAATGDFKTYPGGITPYIGLFMSGRSLFIGTELKVANTLRPMEQPFGVVPFPKLDDSQNTYRSTALHQLSVAMIPVTNADAENTGLLLDALSYESYDKILDLYLAGTVEQKGLRNEESVEMLHLILDTMSYDPGIAYALVSPLEDKLKNALIAGNSSVSSIIASGESAVLVAIDKLNSAAK